MRGASVQRGVLSVCAKVARLNPNSYPVLSARGRLLGRWQLRVTLTNFLLCRMQVQTLSPSKLLTLRLGAVATEQ